MAEGGARSRQVLSLREIAEYHEDTISSLKFYFNDLNTLERFIGYTLMERADELALRTYETSLRSILVTLASVEASFRIDYEDRCRRRLKDDLSKSFREMYKLRQKRVDLDEDIFEAWKRHVSDSKKLIGELKSAFRLRHWLAHGRYWQPKLGRAFDFSAVYDLAVAATESLFDVNH